MGRTGSGVEVREASIRLSFTHEGQQYRRTLTLNGKPLAPSAANLKLAHRTAQDIRARIKAGTFHLSDFFPEDGALGGLTVPGQLDTWLAAQRIEASTKAGYSSAARFWKALLKDKTVRGLVHSDILTALATRPDLTGKTVNNYVSVLREAMQLAVLDKIVPANPVADIPRAKHQKPPPDPFTLVEAEAICAYMAEKYPEAVWNYTEARFFTGMRTGESFGLKWPTVDLPSAYMVVAESIVRGEEKDSTKTHAERAVRLNSRALEAIKRQAKHTRMAGAHVFLDPRYGTPWTEERAYRRSYWTPALKALGIRYRKPYNTRHTYATVMLMQGMTPAFCARQLGHSVEMFLRTYAKWLDGSQDALEMAKLEAALGKKPGKNSGIGGGD